MTDREEIIARFQAHDAMDFDASTRRYYRGADGVLMIDMAAGHEKRIANFVDIAMRLHRANIQTPEIREYDAKAGYLWMGDLGQEALNQSINNVPDREIVKLLLGLKRADFDGLPLYDRAIYTEETDRLLRYHLKPMGIDGGELLTITAPYFEELESRSKQFVHVDFHVENILKTPSGLALIDFQDARIGHSLYDLASFIDDVRMDIPVKIADALYHEFVQSTEDQRDFHILTVQRLMKIIGIFARLNAENYQKYAAFMPRIGQHLERRLKHPDLGLWREWYFDVVPQPLNFMPPPENQERQDD